MKNLHSGVILLLIATLFSSCATIIGGMRYNARVDVPGYPEAGVNCDIPHMANGKNRFRVKRQDADKVAFTISHPGCEDETKRFYSRTFRGWAFAGTLVGFTGLTLPGTDDQSTEDDTWVPIPWGVMLDGMTGAWWKPDQYEYGVTKNTIKYYTYTLDYTGCDTTKVPRTEKIVENRGPLLKFYRRSKGESDEGVKLLINDEVVYSFLPMAYREFQFGEQSSIQVCPQDENQDCKTIELGSEEEVYIKISQLQGSEAVIIERVNASKGEFESVRPKKNMNGAY